MTHWLERGVATRFLHDQHLQLEEEIPMVERVVERGGEKGGQGEEVKLK